MNQGILNLLNPANSLSDNEKERKLARVAMEHKEVWRAVVFMASEKQYDMAVRYLKQCCDPDLHEAGAILESVFKEQELAERAAVARAQAPQNNISLVAPEQKQRTSVTRDRIREAIETLDREGLLTAANLWWAIYRVLSMPIFNWPTDRSAFSHCMEDLAPKTQIPCVYDNWRNIHPAKLVCSPDLWSSLTNLSTAELSQRRVAERLLQLLTTPQE